MRRILRVRLLAAAGALLLVLAGAPTSTSAESPITPLPEPRPPLPVPLPLPSFEGEVPPPDSVGLLITTRALEPSVLTSDLDAAGCNVVTLAVTEGGEWRLFGASSPAFASAAFPGLAPRTPFLVRCGPDDPPQGHEVEVTVSYLERIALPAGAVVSVTLDDVSLQDAPARTISAEATVTQGEQPPFRFSLSYPPEVIEETHTYVARAEIRVQGALWFTTDTAHPVITQGHPHAAEITLVPVLQPDPLTRLQANEWIWTVTTYGDRSNSSPSLLDRTSVRFNADGTVHVDTDCDLYNGTYKADDNEISIALTASTRIACLEGSTASTFITDLLSADRYSVFEERALTLVLADGRGTMSFIAPPFIPPPSIPPPRIPPPGIPPTPIASE